MKLRSYLMHEAFSKADWQEAARIVCREVDLSPEAILSLVDEYDIKPAYGEEESISICAGNIYAYWSSLDGFGSLTFQRSVPSNVIRVHSRNA